MSTESGSGSSDSGDDYIPSDNESTDETITSLDGTDTQGELDVQEEASIPLVSPLKFPASRDNSPATDDERERCAEGPLTTCTTSTAGPSSGTTLGSQEAPTPPLCLRTNSSQHVVDGRLPLQSNEDNDEWISEDEGTRNNVLCTSVEQRLDQQQQQTSRRKTVYCYYCEEPVLQFARHLQRHHDGELEVQRLLCLRKGSLKRKQMLAVIRNKGNYLQSRMTLTPRPVRKPTLHRESSKPLPCNCCYGYFARKQLWRHVKRCPARKLSEKGGPDGRNTLNLAQNMTLMSVEGNSFLKNHVYPRMRADEITAAVKSDPLICAYGARLSKTHQDKHQVNFISRKMRELGKLLIALKKEDTTIKSLIDALKPEKYAVLVSCTKNVSGYNAGTNTFASPTYAMTIQTSIKDCCEVACTYLYQHVLFKTRQEYEDAEFPFKRLIAAITSDWKFDVSHQAANNLENASMNKITMVPLANDLYRFRAYLINLANESVGALQFDDRDQHAFKNLVESVYCRVMLLCRKRCGELSRLTIDVYVKSGERHSYEEFADTIRPSEMVLVRKFKRVVIQGKRKTTPVIFSADVQQHIDVILKVRPHFVPDTNPFLFGNVNTENPISGYKVIQKHARNADLVHPQAVTTRALRKHLATVCQVLSMSNEDIEQIACFMGHSPGVHRKEYRLPDELFQTAKVSKLLLMMESGQAARYKGKTLDEIDIDMESDIVEDIRGGGMCLRREEEEDDEWDEGGAQYSEDLDVPQQGLQQQAHPVPQCTNGPSPCERSTSQRRRRSPEKCTTTMTSSCDGTQGSSCGGGGTLLSPGSSTSLSAPQASPKKKKFRRDPWPAEDKALVLKHFAEHIRLKKPPKKEECLKLITDHPDKFKNRTWEKIKVLVHNCYYTCSKM